MLNRANAVTPAQILAVHVMLAAHVKTNACLCRSNAVLLHLLGVRASGRTCCLLLRSQGCWPAQSTVPVDQPRVPSADCLCRPCPAATHLARHWQRDRLATVRMLTAPIEAHNESGSLTWLVLAALVSCTMKV